jgi:hypothetical protein
MFTWYQFKCLCKARKTLTLKRHNWHLNHLLQVKEDTVVSLQVYRAVLLRILLEWLSSHKCFNKMYCLHSTAATHPTIQSNTPEDWDPKDTLTDHNNGQH